MTDFTLQQQILQSNSVVFLKGCARDTAHPGWQQGMGCYQVDEVSGGFLGAGLSSDRAALCNRGGDTKQTVWKGPAVRSPGNAPMLSHPLGNGNALLLRGPPKPQQADP